MTPPDARRVLAVALHPDDLESWCAGTLARFVARGARVAYLVVTSGDKGSADPQAEPGRLAATREAEQLAAAALLGVHDVTFLRYPDGEVTDSLPLRAAIAAAIRRVRPDLLLTFDPWTPYTFHGDHREGSLAALAAAYPLAARPGPLPSPHAGAPAAPHATRAAWLFHTSRPNRYVDITATFDRKVAARAAHASQTGDVARLTDTFRERAAAIGAAAGLPLAEAFHEVRFPTAPFTP